ncbi:MAG: hypothetical protein ACE5KE_15705 [Methanosarcinales archaeon]
MSNSELEVRIFHDKKEIIFKGSPKEVQNQFLKFITEIYPAYDLAKRVTLVVDLEKILRDVEDVIAIAEEGPILLIKNLKDRDAIGLYLLANYITFKLNKTEKDSLTIGEIIKKTGKTSGGIGARLSELIKEGLVERIGKGEYKITTLGIKEFTENIIPKLKGGV